jgi:hypothetical protein
MMEWWRDVTGHVTPCCQTTLMTLLAWEELLQLATANRSTISYLNRFMFSTEFTIASTIQEPETG